MKFSDNFHKSSLCLSYFGCMGQRGKKQWQRNSFFCELSLCRDFSSLCHHPCRPFRIFCYACSTQVSISITKCKSTLSRFTMAPYFEFVFSHTDYCCLFRLARSISHLFGHSPIQAIIFYSYTMQKRVRCFSTNTVFMAIL